MRNVYLAIPLICGTTFVATGYADEVPVGVAKECTATEEIYNRTSIRTNDNISKEQKRTAILNALGHSTSNPNFVVHNFKGQWFYEYETENAVFAGYKIRAHYLRIAIVYTKTGMDTIICDSQNLRQSEDSIHRKAPIWKQTFDTKVKVQIARLSTKPVTTKQTGSEYMKMLESLYSRGFLTKIEYEEIKRRIQKNTR